MHRVAIEIGNVYKEGLPRQQQQTQKEQQKEQQQQQQLKPMMRKTNSLHQNHRNEKMQDCPLPGKETRKK